MMMKRRKGSLLAGSGQADPDPTAGATGHVDDGDRAVVQLDDPAGDGEAEAGTAAGRPIAAREPLEHPVPRVDRYTRSLIADLDHQPVRLGEAADGDGTVRRPVPYRVVEQIDHDMVQPFAVGVPGDVRRRHLDPEL